MKNKKGFTLIELLAVIVILGILMIVAIPMLTNYIESSRKSTYTDTAKSYINAAKLALTKGEYSILTSGGTSICGLSDNPYIYLKDINVDNTGDKSAFGGKLDLEKSFVQVKMDEATGKYTYSIFIKDSKGAGTNGIVQESDLDASVIKNQE